MQFFRWCFPLDYVECFNHFAICQSIKGNLFRSSLRYARSINKSMLWVLWNIFASNATQFIKITCSSFSLSLFTLDILLSTTLRNVLNNFGSLVYFQCNSNQNFDGSGFGFGFDLVLAFVLSSNNLICLRFKHFDIHIPIPITRQVSPQIQTYTECIVLDFQYEPFYPLRFGNIILRLKQLNNSFRCGSMTRNTLTSMSDACTKYPPLLDYEVNILWLWLWRSPARSLLHLYKIDSSVPFAYPLRLAVPFAIIAYCV